MRSYHKALPRVAAILFFLVLASVVTPRNSTGLLQPQSPISPITTPTSAAYLPLAVREMTAHQTSVVCLPLVIR
jgi:hypothetical protein